MPKSAIVIKDLSVTLAHNVPVLRDISMEIGEGKITGFIGPSGAGKTTLIRSIVGRQKITGGSISVLRQPAGTPALRQDVSYMTQEVSVYSDLSVLGNLRYFAQMHGVPRKLIAPMLAEIIAIVDLKKQQNQLVGSLSGGQKQRVSLAIALIGKPKLMVLDEPTVGLDPVLREQLWMLFRKLASSGTTIVISSHVMDEAERCDELVLIRDGALLAFGGPKDLCARTKTTTVEQAFLALVGAAS